MSYEQAFNWDLQPKDMSKEKFMRLHGIVFGIMPVVCKKYKRKEKRLSYIRTRYGDEFLAHEEVFTGLIDRYYRFYDKTSRVD